MSLTTDFSSLTFETIKDQIIAQLKNSDAFFDYEFTGARLNALVDALAYTVLYGGAYANASVIESWRQLAVQRSSVVQHAQNVGYVPSSKIASIAHAKIELTRTTPDPLIPYVTIPRGTRFSGQKGSSTYPFVLADDFTILGVNQYQSIIPLVQGRFLSETVNWTATSRIFIKDANTDRRYTKVTVNGEVWKKSDNAARVDSKSKVFYMRETLEGWTEIYFGVSNLVDISGQLDMSVYIGGKTPDVGDTIVIEYLVTDADAANDTNSFKIISSISGFSVTVTSLPDTSEVRNSAQGGADKEDIERIRAVSDKMWQAQGRCVVPSDYENFILSEFSSFISAIKCWTQRGNYGVAYIAIKPKNGLELSKTQKTEISTYLEKYNVSTVQPLIIAPVYIFINHIIDVDYDPNLLDITVEQLKQNVIKSMDSYYTNTVNDFGIAYQTSKLLSEIDATHKSILGSSCEIDVVKELQKDMFWSGLTKGSTLSAPTEPRGIITAPFTYNEYDTTDPEYPMFVNTHELKIFSTDSNKLIIGPFLPTAAGIDWVECEIVVNDILYNELDHGAFDEPEYYSNDIAYTSKVKYYVIGSYITETGSGGSSFTQDNFDSSEDKYRWDSKYLDETSITYFIKVKETSIYPAQGEIIVFDQYLRPEYITLTPHAIMS